MLTTGTIDYFNAQKGFGFIRLDSEDDLLIVHFSVIQTERFKKLRKGQRVRFFLNQSEKGAYATDIKVITQ